MDSMEKLRILTDAAKYDVACTSSGVDRAGVRGQLGSAAAAGICHSFASDGRCISLLKVLMSNACAYDCSYCLNRKTNGTERATFRPRELADLTIQFYRRNYIEGLFLSSAVTNYTLLNLQRCVFKKRDTCIFNSKDYNTPCLCNVNSSFLVGVEIQSFNADCIGLELLQ